MTTDAAYQVQQEEVQLPDLVAAAQAGDARAREQILYDYRPFFLRVASNSCRKYLVLGRDDEASIAMIAFNEAIDSYNSDGGASFLSFAELVIKRRLVDYFRRQARRTDEIPLSSFEDEDNEEGVIQRLEAKEAHAVMQLQEEAEERREEIFRLDQLLSNYGIRFSELVKISPKHRDARDRALVVAKTLVSDPELLAYLTRKKSLPLKDLEQRVNVSRKTLERQRKYIITLALVLIGDFTHLQEYLNRPV
ncbi:MAG: RNA polymerase sigma factor SigI [Firmicutes bacterium]|jgi:RNA polymerase sigma factor|nr:RNA polymerase sigma factor SigI [Bacillota bacterium]NLO65240.1 RNA polymerase sigma factor SigI [Bacillota bacterium]